MKTVLVYSTVLQGAQESLQLDEAIEQYKNGNKVFFLHCDASVGGCNNNPRFNRCLCRLCVRYQKMLMDKYLPAGIVRLSVGDLIGDGTHAPGKVKFDYDNCSELQNVVYKGVEIGMGCVSTYISLTRNMYPAVTPSSRVYFDRLLESQVVLTDAVNSFLDVNKIDLIVFHNGRYAQYKPLLDIARQRGIDFVCTEAQRDSKGIIRKNYFYNTIPHDIGVNTRKFFSIWENADVATREEIGRNFFERKRGKKATGDKIYNANQTDGLLSDNWASDKENIVIFNSSEDEYCAIGRDFDSRKFFKSQLDGIRTILEHYKNDVTKHFYLRIHPNLNDVGFKYHTDLYRLDYPNLTVIPGDSRISTYALIDNADKIITFGSTVGAESAYRDKPVINLGPSLYNELGITYIPGSMDELWEIMDTPGLPGRYNENVLKYGYYYMALYDSMILERCGNIDNTPVNYNILGKRYFVYSYQKILGSNFLYMLAQSVARRFSSLFSKDMTIPDEEA